MKHHVQNCICFGRIEVDLRGHAVFRGGSRIALQEQPMQILLALLEAPGEVVTRDTLRNRLWGAETFVDFNQSLNSAIRRLRHALEDDPHDPVYIETIPRVGYRLIADTSASVSSKADWFDAGAGTEFPRSSEPMPARRWKPSWPGAGRRFNPAIAAWSLVVFAGSMLIVGQYRLDSRPLEHNQAVQNAVVRTQPATVVVLPFRNLTGKKEDEAFVEGITDAVTTKLAERPELRVAAGTPAQFVLHRQGVGAESQPAINSPVLEGAMHRRKDRVWITTRLFDPSNRTYLWASTYSEQASHLSSNEINVAEDVARHVGSRLAHNPGSQQKGK